MRVPVPRNRLVAFTLAGALLTAIVAGALAMPGGLAADRPDAAGASAPGDSPQVSADAPTPNQAFTPAVQRQSGGGEEHEDEYEAEEEHEDEAHEDEDD